MTHGRVLKERMNLELKRDSFLSSGIFGTIFNQDKTFILQTLEHAFAFPPDGPISDSTIWRPIIPQGVYICIRGMHQLEGMKAPFQTFMITGVEGHTGLLFHVGNFNKDSIGCCLLGISRDMSVPMICDSADAFNKFMALQSGVNEFQLTVD